VSLKDHRDQYVLYRAITASYYAKIHSFSHQLQPSIERCSVGGSVSTPQLIVRLVFLFSEFVLTTGARHGWDSNPDSHGCTPSALPLAYPTIPIRIM